MTQRERILAIAVGCLLGVFGLLVVYTTVSGGFARRRNDVTRIKNQITLARTENGMSKAARQRVYEYQKRSLPQDTSAAQRDYDEWLYELCQEAGLENETVQPQQIIATTKKMPYRELSFVVSGQGEVDKLTKFLYGFYATDNLHRIRILNLNPLRDSRQLKIMMTVDAISMEDFDLEKLQEQTEPTLSKEQLDEMAQKIAVGTTGEDRLPLGLAEYLAQITGRNLFAPANLPPRIKSVSRQEVEVGGTLSFRAEATDPDEHGLEWKLGPDAPDGADISESGRFRRTAGNEERDFEFTVIVSDKGFPPKQDECTVRVAVVPPREPRTVIERAGIDESKLAVLTAFVQGRMDPAPLICMHLRSEDEFQYLGKGDEIKIGNWDGVVTSVELHKSEARIRTDEGDFVLKLGQTLADAEFIEAEDYRRPENEDGPVETQETADRT